jgi:divinyl protochlorophyllide a 8-vinyl-reductase
MTAHASEARIGPNAITRTLESLRERLGEAETLAVLGSAGLARYASDAPHEMVPEADVSALFHALRARLGPQESAATARLAGLKTADYVLAYRIPAPARALLRLLPPALAAPLLLRSIAQHTWTFAGSATIAVVPGQPLHITVERCPICRGEAGTLPACSYYAATFERLFRALVTARAAVTEVACEALGAPACSFEVRY